MVRKEEPGGMRGHAARIVAPDPRGVRAHGEAVVVAVLAMGVLALTAACGSAGSPASSSSPTVSSTTSSPAGSPSQSASPTEAPSGSSSSGGGSAAVTAHGLTTAQAAPLVRAANGHCGFESATDTLGEPKETNNGWATGYINAKNSANQGNASMYLRNTGGGWTYFTCGSQVTGVPQSVRNAFDQVSGL
jgi:hypothetical protein